MNIDMDFFYNIRKQNHLQRFKGVITRGKTIRSRSGKTPLCATCHSNYCEHIIKVDYKDLIYKYTDNSRMQKKNVHKCCNCDYTHICEHNIPVRGRHIKPDIDI